MNLGRHGEVSVKRSGYSCSRSRASRRGPAQHPLGGSIGHVAIWCICATGIIGVLTRPRGIPEWVWAVSAALSLVAFRLIAPVDAAGAVRDGTDVYLFLAGMMVLAELARREKLFDWIAMLAARAAAGSRMRLFGLVYGAGTLVTIVLSNDATAVVLTPAVAAVARRAKAAPLPYLYACAFVANAASFVLPISNPANLVVFGGHVPTLAHWLGAFALPSLLAIAATFAALAFAMRADLRGPAARGEAPTPLAPGGRVALVAIALTAAALIAASAIGAPLGIVTCVASAFAFVAVAWVDRSAARAVLRSVSWSVLGLVAGLFVLVRGLDATGLQDAARHAADVAATWPQRRAVFALGIGSALASNLTNNLPAGLVAGTAVAHLAGHEALKNATAVGIDLGPNFSVTGSLATVLWLIALRRENVAISAAAFLRVGAFVTPLALLSALGALCATSR